MSWLVTAYRWGWTNNHHYIVYCGDDYDRAMELAEEEANDRGGKYGVVVRSYTEDYSRTFGYFPSSWGEKLPYHNYRLDYISRLGHMLEDYLKDNPDHELVQKAEGQKAFYDAIQKAIEELPENSDG